MWMTSMEMQSPRCARCVCLSVNEQNNFIFLGWFIAHGRTLLGSTLRKPTASHTRRRSVQICLLRMTSLMSLKKPVFSTCLQAVCSPVRAVDCEEFQRWHHGVSGICRLISASSALMGWAQEVVLPSKVTPVDCSTLQADHILYLTICWICTVQWH